jgi:hypothetical protein
MPVARMKITPYELILLLALVFCVVHFIKSNWPVLGVSVLLVIIYLFVRMLR